MRAKCEVGAVFGRLTLVRREADSRYADGALKKNWTCLCECGNAQVTTAKNLLSGGSTSCGCKGLESLIKGNKKRAIHSSCKTGAYKSWQAMKERCLNPKSQNFARYGGIGISVDRFFIESFSNFLAEVGDRPPKMSLGRIDNNKGYIKGNIRWESLEQQANNTSKNVFITLDGKTNSLAQWAQLLEVPYDTIWSRIKRGWPPEDALRVRIGARYRRPEGKRKKKKLIESDTRRQVTPTLGTH